ncbi:MAG: peptidylprolyl isomerase [Lactobacillales bacterium]|jgi:peptidyl-prolyl cis-trans isomerase C|nr:peptidylprolyl isomerase [Lactobacillales bacterium]
MAKKKQAPLKKKTQQTKAAPVAAAKPVVETRPIAEKGRAGRWVWILLAFTLLVWGCVGYLVYDKMTTPFKAAPVDKVVAIVNGETIHMSEVYQAGSSIPQLAELPFEMIYPQLLENIINARVLMNGADKAGIENDRNVARALKMAREQILSQAYLSKKLESMMTPEKLRAIYDEEMKHYVPEEEIRARHILTKTLKEAKDVIIQLKAGADFAMLADTKSIDLNGRGGELGYFTKNMMPVEFSDAVFTLKKGQISEPIKTAFGWHVILVEDRRPSPAPAFEDVQEQLQQLFVEQNALPLMKQERENMDVQVIMPYLKPINPTPKKIRIVTPEESTPETPAETTAAAQ